MTHYRITYEITASKGPGRRTALVTTEAGSPESCKTLARYKARRAFPGDDWTIRLRELERLRVPTHPLHDRDGLSGEVPS